MADHSERQSAIDALGIIGDMRSAALVNDKGSVDFFCWPEFDSPSIFCSLLDGPEAGVFQLAPDLPDARREQIYLSDTNVLQTRWLSDHAVVEVTDLLPIGDSEDDLPMLIRRVRVVSGQATIRMRCAVRHDYARAPTKARTRDRSVYFETTGQPAMQLCKEGAAALCLERTLKFWRDWIGQSNYRGRWRGMVNRSALALKLLTSRKHGAILAAATFGLPEVPGGERNWDYRYTWIRDASFTVYAFMRLGFVEEANAYTRWLRGRVRDCHGKTMKLNILYAIDGRQELPEVELPHLAGHGGATPVRIGNQAYDQIQLDIFGELMDAVYLVNKYGEAISLEAIEKSLVRAGMVYRYRNDDNQIDGLPGTEGAFAACSFWYVECLARAGQVEKAHLEFEQLLRYANPLGLYAEELDSHARHLGNTPQALTHLALISAASFLDRKLRGEKNFWQP